MSKASSVRAFFPGSICCLTELPVCWHREKTLKEGDFQREDCNWRIDRNFDSGVRATAKPLWNTSSSSQLREVRSTNGPFIIIQLKVRAACARLISTRNLGKIPEDMSMLANSRGEITQGPTD